MTKKERAKLRRQRKICRTVTTIALMVLTAVIAISGTVAWLTDKSEKVKNTFTIGDINIKLKETTGDSYKIIPGVDIDKDPKVTVKAGSEACWLFVKIEEKHWPAPMETVGESTVRKVNYDIADGWTALGTAYPGVYYRSVDAVSSDTEFAVLKDNKVTVSQNLTKTEANAIGTGDSAPTLTFTAYACQYLGFEIDAPGAWENASAVSTPG